MRLLLIFLSFSLTAWAASEENAAGGAGASGPVGSPVFLEADIDRVAAALAAAPREQQALFLMAGGFNGDTVSGKHQTVIEEFRKNYAALKTFNVESLKEDYYRILVEGVSIAISLRAKQIAEPLQSIPRGTPPLKDALPQFHELESTLGMLASLYLGSAFTFKETDAPGIRGSHFFILNKLEEAYHNLHTVVTPLYGIENNAFRKALLESACKYSESAVTAGQDVCELSLVNGCRVKHAFALLQLYQIPPFGTKGAYRRTLNQIRESFRKQAASAYTTCLDALLAATEAFDDFHAARDKLTAESNGRKNARYMDIYEMQRDQTKAKAAQLVGIANTIWGEENIDPVSLLKAKISLLNVQLSMYTPSLIGKRALEVSAPHVGDLEGLEILERLESTIKDLVRVEGGDGVPRVAAAAAAAAAATEEITLLDAYRRYALLFPEYKQQIIEIVFFLIRSGKFGEALGRLEVLAGIEREGAKPVGTMVEWASALCEGYMGNWGSYNALRAAQVAKMAARDATKAKTRDAALAHQALRALEAVATAEESERERIARAAAAVEARRATHVSTAGEAGGVVDRSLEDRMAAAALERMRMAEREAAAKERAAARAAAKAEVASAPASVGGGAAAAAAAAGGAGISPERGVSEGGAGLKIMSEDDLNVDLATLFELSGTAKKVEREIVGKTWKISRRDLITYFENLGCTIRQTKGSHEVVKLPEVTEIIVNDQVVAVIPDEGGSGTLPDWDGDNFPPYLITQMRNLRAILAVSAGEAAARLAEEVLAAAAAEADLLAEEPKSGKASAKGGSTGKKKKR